MNKINVFTNYQVNGYHSYFALTEIIGGIKSDVSVYKLPDGYKAVVIADGKPGIECPDGEIITQFTDRADCPVFKTHSGKHISLKLIA